MPLSMPSGKRFSKRFISSIYSKTPRWYRLPAKISFAFVVSALFLAKYLLRHKFFDSAYEDICVILLHTFSLCVMAWVLAGTHFVIMIATTASNDFSSLNK
jgi:hypothetical protein